jgi:hypothetical protein
MNSILKYLLHAVILFVALLVVAFLTRNPALNNSSIYALHAVLVAFFNAGIVAFYLRRAQVLLPVAVAVLLLAAFLGMMQPVMALGFLVPLLISLGLWTLLRNRSVNLASGVTAAVFAALPYPTLVVSAILTDSLMGLEPLSFLTWLLIACALGFVGALVGVFIAQKTGKADKQ